MRYMLLIHADPEAMAAVTPEEYARIGEAYTELSMELAGTGELLGGDPLQQTDTATTVRLLGGEPVPSDGPFVETKEYLCGYFLVECADLDRAVEIAGRVPGLRLGGVEVRPVVPIPASATDLATAAASGAPAP